MEIKEAKLRYFDGYGVPLEEKVLAASPTTILSACCSFLIYKKHVMRQPANTHLALGLLYQSKVSRSNYL